MRLHNCELWKKIGVIFLMTLTTLYAFAIFLSSDPLNCRRNSFDAMITGHAEKPFVYRVFVPQTARLMEALTPKTLTSRFEKWAEAYQGITTSSRQAQSHATAMVYALLLMLIAFVGSIGVIDSLWNHFFHPNPYLAVLLPLGTIPFFSYTYLYDLPTLFFFALGSWALLKQRWFLYALAFGVGILNKETMLLILLLYLITAPRMLTRKQWIGGAILQFIYALSIKGILAWIFLDNPGSIIEYHFYKTLAYTIHSYSLYECMGWLGVSLLVLYHFSEKPKFIREGMALFIPFFILYKLFGWEGEYRVFLELYPFFALSAFHTIVTLVKGSPPPRIAR